VLQDFERLNKMMKQIIDTVDAPAMLERMQAFKEVLEASLEEKIKASTEKGTRPSRRSMKPIAPFI
jgi:hypothetical protein